MTTFPAKYYYEYTNRETGELLLSGTVTGINKHDCKKRAHNEALQHGLKPMMDDSIKFYIKATEDSRPGFNQNEYIANYNKENYARVELKIPKDKKADWTAKAKAEGLSLTAWITKQIEGK